MTWMELLNGWGAAFIGGFFGSAGGAWGAQRIAERVAVRKESLLELRNINAAIQLAFSTCNTALAYRQQFSKGIWEKLKQDKDDVEVVKSFRLHEGDSIHVSMDLRMFPIPSPPIGALKDLVLSKIDVLGRTVSAVSKLEQALVGMAEASEQRNDFIKSNDHGTGINGFKYLGIKNNGGPLDERYCTWVSCLDAYAADVAFFSKIICHDLQKQGGMVRDRLVILNGKKATGIPKVNAVDFSAEGVRKYLPPDSNYERWTRGFRDTKVDSPLRLLNWWHPSFWRKKPGFQSK